MERFRNLLATTMQIFCNPIGLANMVIAATGNVLVLCRLVTRPKVLPVVSMIWPVPQGWVVLRGGVSRKTSHSWEVVGQRYAFDIMHPTDRDTEFRDLSDSKSFGTPIRAPMTGVVHWVRGASRDCRLPGTGAYSWWATTVYGNAVAIRNGDRLCILAHLEHGSVTCQKGQMVNQGDVIGNCGNSGRSFMPHLHVHVQMGLNPLFGLGVPIEWVEPGPELKKLSVAGDDIAHESARTVVGVYMWQDACKAAMGLLSALAQVVLFTAFWLWLSYICMQQMVGLKAHIAGW